MRFLVDAQLPRRPCAWFDESDCDAIHTLDLPDGNSTTDEQIIALATKEQRVVVSKDSDFPEYTS
jgi:predicted nuclease of predicted toxin-antitoxin system